MSLASSSGAIRLREPITPESLCVALNRATSLQLAPRDVVLAYHHWRWVAHLLDQRTAFVADTVDARNGSPENGNSSSCLPTVPTLGCHASSGWTLTATGISG